MFPEYDLRRQVACMRALQNVAECPVPSIVADDCAGAVIGRPLYLMTFVPGDIPSDDRPTFFEAGFLFDATQAEQSWFYRGMLKALCALHAFEFPGALADCLSRQGRRAARPRWRASSTG